MKPRIPKIAVILLIALLLRIIFFTGFNASDDYVLLKTADDLNKNKMDFDEIFNPISIRLTLLYPISFLIRLVGINDITISILPLLCSIGTIFLTYLIAKKLFNKKTALLSATLLSFFPLEVLHGSILVAETIGSFLMLLGIYLFLLDKKMNYFLSGVLIGLAYVTKVTFVFVLPLLLLYLLYLKKKIVKEHICLILGFLLILIPELIFFYIKTGNVLFRYELIRNFTSLITPEKTQLLKEVLFRYPYITLNPINFQVGLFFYLFYTCVIVAIIKKIKKLYPLIIFAAFFVLYLNFGSTQLTQYIPLPRSIRYFMMVSAPLTLISSYTLTNLKHKIRKTIIPLVLTILIITTIGYLYFASNTLYESSSVNNMKQIKDLIDTNKTLYIDQNNYIALHYLTGFDDKKKIMTFKNLDDDFTKIKDAYIIIDKEIPEQNILFGNSTREEFLNYINKKGEIIKNISGYQKKGCEIISNTNLLIKNKFLKNKIKTGCKYTNLSVYYLQ
ncbi:MAG: glycosyltransferase family 39 protein [Nanoarchaeota archaeon]|nr:glycosyltransferase family 39 protein [Nanoarchaeota archaeon]